LPATVTRPGGASSSEPAFAPYRPPPVEDDEIEGGTGSLGMAPEIVINLEEELEDLNTDLLTMDRQSDSPHPLSPRQTVVLDGALAEIERNNNDPDFDPVSTVLAEVPSTQPTALPTPPRRVVRKVEGAKHRLPAPPTASTPMPALPTLGRTRGRRILHLAAPPKMARVSARREPAQYFVPPSPWAFEVPPQPSIEFRAETPMVVDTPMEQGNRFPSTPDPFQDTDEDFCPLIASWGDIMEQEDRAAAAAVLTVTTVPDTPVTTTVVPAVVDKGLSHSILPHRGGMTGQSAPTVLTCWSL